MSLVVGPQSYESSNATARVLIVDDEQGITKLLVETLRQEGYSCLGCESGQEALRFISNQGFDAVISDVRMPGMSGLELLRSVREAHPHLAFVMVTGVDDVSVCVQIMKEGADDYLVKPLNLQAVRLSVKRVLERKKEDVEAEKHHLLLEETVEKRTRQLQNAMRQRERTYDETLQALAAALDLRDNATSGHSQRVMRYATEIAKAMRCANEQVKTVARGALLHDIGKIAIPDAILTKAGPLTPAERALMETHVRHGYDILSGIAFLDGAAEIVLTHHERFDGRGYPQGLRGEEIPLGARVFSVADTLDAMTSDRPYRRALSLDVARNEISEQSGAQFDPEVVSAFFSIDEVVLGFQRLVADRITDELADGSRTEFAADARPVGLNSSDTGP